jgi:hypothetical protein
MQYEIKQNFSLNATFDQRGKKFIQLAMLDFDGNVERDIRFFSHERKCREKQNYYVGIFIFGFWIVSKILMILKLIPPTLSKFCTFRIPK